MPDSPSNSSQPTGSESPGTSDASGGPEAVQGDPLREIVLVKNGQRYVFRYSPGDERKLLDNLAQMARDPKCDLGWFDAAVLSHQMGKGLEQELQRRMKA